MMRTKGLLAGLLVLVLAGCSSGATTSPSVEPSAELTPQPSEAAPSPTPTFTASVLDVKVTFDGETCTYLGPTVIVDGTVLRFEYAPGQQVADSSLLVYGVKPATTYQMLLDSPSEDVTENIPPWVIQETAGYIYGAGTMLYTIHSVKRGSDAVDYAVGGYQVLCDTPAVYPAVQLAVAGP